ncbi:MAG: hypothetical protein JWM93_1402 [Frankiales bacterium]|nr:hypothetical protein [Frankiales bacterium]
MSRLPVLAARGLRVMADRLAPLAPEPAASPAPVVGQAMSRAEVRARCLALAKGVDLEPDWLVHVRTETLVLLNVITELELEVRAAAWDEVERTWR